MTFEIAAKTFRREGIFLPLGNSSVQKIFGFYQNDRGNFLKIQRDFDRKCVVIFSFPVDMYGNEFSTG